MKNTVLNVGLLCGLLSLGGVAQATQYTWNFSDKSPSSTGGYLEYFSTAGSKSLKVYAFRSVSSDGSGKLVDAQVTADGGLGVNSGETSWPDNLTLDNNGKDDVLVFDSGMSNFDWSSFKLSFIYTGSGGDSSPDMTYWAGNGNGGAFNPATDFNNLCLKSGTTACASAEILGNAGSGFSGGTGIGPLNTSTAASLTTNNKGRFLVVSGQLPDSGGFEKVKIGSVGGKVPEPQSMALLALGMLAMFGIWRGKPRAVPFGQHGRDGFA